MVMSREQNIAQNSNTQTGNKIVWKGGTV
jgi:hypothetical protein